MIEININSVCDNKKELINELQEIIRRLKNGNINSIQHKESFFKLNYGSRSLEIKQIKLKDGSRSLEIKQIKLKDGSRSLEIKQIKLKDAKKVINDYLNWEK